MDTLVETMQTHAHVDLWAVLRDDLRLKLGEELFERWIAPLKVISDAGDEICLGVPNLFVQDWIRKRYLPVIEAVLCENLRDGSLGCLEGGRTSAGGSADAVSRPRRVVLVIDPVLYRERRRESEQVLGERAPREEGVEERVPTRVGSDGQGDLLGIEPGSPKALARDGDQTLESFIVGEPNRHAYNAALQILDRPGSLYNPLFLFGPSGAGKTHLLKGLYRTFRSRRRAGQFLKVSYLTGEQFFQHYVASIQDRTMRKFQERYRGLDVLILDDVHLLVNKKKTQLEFLHTFSSLADSGRQIILASDGPPRALKDLEAGLVDRFSSGLVAGIKRPDFATRLGIARAQARALSARFDDEVLRFVAESIRGNAREILGAVKLLHHHAQMEKGEEDRALMTLEKAQAILADFIREHSRRVDFKKIHEVVAQHFGIAPEVLVSGNRERPVAFARQVAMFLARRYTRKSLVEVGKYFGKRNHTTVKCAEAKMVRLLKPGGGSVAHDVEAIMEALEE